MSTDLATVDIAAAESRPVPANLEAEAALLGVVLSENSAFDAVADIVTPADFYEPLHARIYETALAEAMSGRLANPVTLKGHFADDPAMKELGGVGYLARLTGDLVGFISGPRELAIHIRELARRRAMLAQLVEAVRACTDMSVGLDAVADLAMSVSADDAGDGVVEASAGACVEAHLASVAEGAGGVTCNRIPSFDKIVGPLRAKQFILLAARPGMGKTALSMSYSIGAARSGHGVLFVSIEMSGEELGSRAAADMCFGLDGDGRVPYACIRDGDLTEWARQRVGRAAVELDRLPLVIVDVPSITPGRLSRMVRRQARRFAARGTPLELVIVDYIQRMKPDRQMGKKYEEISEISAALKDIAKANGVAIMGLAQLSREVERRGDKRPVLADLRDSGQLEQDADTVIFLLRQEYYHRQAEPDPLAQEWPGWKDKLERMTGEIEFIVAKRRGGETGSARGEFHGAFQAVRG